MPEKNSLHAMLTEPISARMWFVTVVSSVASTALGVALLVGGDWLPGAVLLAAVVVGWGGRIPRLWRRYRERSRHSPPTGAPGQ